MAASDHLNSAQMQVRRSSTESRPPNRGYSITSGRQAGEMRFPAPWQNTWYHGTNDRDADAIVRSQKLYGSGDFGNGGYVAIDKDNALDWTHTDPETYQQTGEASDFPGLVKATLTPKRPYYGGGEVKGVERDKTVQKLKAQGNDVWFPLKGAKPSSPGSYGVLLNENKGGETAKFTKEELDPFLVSDYEGWHNDD